MLYEIANATVALGGETILDHVDFYVKGTEKIALVGENGAGKTTLLRLIAGELSPERDDKSPARLQAARHFSRGFLRQIMEPGQQALTVEQLLESLLPPEENEKERFAFQAEYDRLFTGFGLAKEDKKKKLGEFSGGEQTKIAFIRLLLSKPDLLLLDEPTNHLDLQTTEWLEGYLRSYPGAVVMVSHDRFFLDRTAEAVVEVARKKLTRYPGNYTAFREEKARRIEAQEKAYLRQQEEIAREKALIERFRHRPNKAAFARSRKQMLSRMERVEKPVREGIPPKIGDITPLIPGSRHVLEAEHAKIGYGKPLFELSLRMTRGMKLAVLGENGAGKTTLLKTANGLLRPLSGTLRLGKQVTIGYFDQQTAQIMREGAQGLSVAEHFLRLFPALTEKELRSTLGRYLFGGREAAKPVSGLSGGECARLALAELLEARPNFLILDEPTNHCDIRTQEVLEAALTAYKGTVLFVSHDRYFTREVASAILLIKGQEVSFYPFDYEHYLAQREKAKKPVAQMSAENQALIESLRAVPRGTFLPSREISTAEAYADWRLQPVKAALAEAAERACAAQEEEKQAREAWEVSAAFWAWLAAADNGQDTAGEEKAGHAVHLAEVGEPPALAAWYAAKERLRLAEEEWTEQCLAYEEARQELR